MKQITIDILYPIQKTPLSNIAGENPPKTFWLQQLLSYEGFRTDSSTNCRLHAGLSTILQDCSQMFLSVQLPTIPADLHSRRISSAHLRISLIVACGIAAEWLAFTVGFEAVLEDEWKNLDALLSNNFGWYSTPGDFIRIY